MRLVDESKSCAISAQLISSAVLRDPGAAVLFWGAAMECPGSYF